MVNLSLLGLLLTLVSGSCATTLVPPLHQGVIVKVSEQLIADIARVITDQAIPHIKALTLSGRVKEGGITYRYWDLQYQELSLTPAIDLTKQAGRHRLILDATAQGDFRATATWRATKRTWFYNFEFDGGVTVTSRGFGVTSRVILGENDEGHVGFTHDPTYCTLDMGDFDMDFSGSTGWIINYFVGFFEDEIRTVFEEYVCLEINKKVEEGARELETAIFDRYDVIYILGHRIEINNRPWIVTGGDTCAVVGGLGGIHLDMIPDRGEGQNTEPFFPPTLPPIITEKPKDRTDFETTSSSYETTTLDRGEGERKRREAVEGERKRREEMEGERKRREAVEEAVEGERKRRQEMDWCDVLPGSGRGVSVIITEEMIERIARNLHDVRLIDYRATQNRGTAEIYDVEWGGKSAGTVRIPTPNNDLLRDYHVTFRITSTAPPNVTIGTDGVAMFSNLRARVTLEKDSLVTKVEIHTTVKFLGVCDLTYLDGMYKLVPTVTGSADVNNAKFNIGGPGGINVPDGLIQEIEDELNEMLSQTVPELIREELKAGFPLNIPDNLVITKATVEYREEYILVTAEDVVVNLF